MSRSTFSAAALLVPSLRTAKLQVSLNFNEESRLILWLWPFLLGFAIKHGGG
jgi:hypothetical protein